MSRVIEVAEGVSYEAAGSPWALFLYERACTGEDGSRANWYADYMAALDPSSGVSPLFLAKTLWAMAKAADDASVPDLEGFLRSFEGSVQLSEPWQRKVVEAINAEIFRADGKEAEE